MKQRITVALSESVINAIDEAGEIWTEFKGNRSALVSKIVIEYSRGRSENGGKTARLEKQVNRLAEEMAQMRADMALIKEKLGIYDHDTDHA